MQFTRNSAKYREHQDCVKSNNDRIVIPTACPDSSGKVGISYNVKHLDFRFHGNDK